MKRPSILLCAAAIGLAGCGSEPATDTDAAADTAATPPADAGADVNAGAGDGGVETAGAVTLAIATKESFGRYMVDDTGRSLYILEGTRAGEKATACTGACLEEWPPLIAATPQAAQGLDPSKLATVPRDGRQQVTYAGWPLYYYHDDTQPGSTTGQGVHDQWGGWYLLAPSGEPIETH